MDNNSQKTENNDKKANKNTILLNFDMFDLQE
jgi:hypothetical protein